MTVLRILRYVVLLTVLAIRERLVRLAGSR
jgi:hypothetical protein